METLLSWGKFLSYNMSLIFVFKSVFRSLLAGLLASYLSPRSIRVHLIISEEIWMFSGQHFLSQAQCFFCCRTAGWKCVVLHLFPFFSLLLFTFCPLELPQCLPDELLTLIMCRKMAEGLLHISSFSLILKLVLLLCLNPYCACVMRGCTRSELAVRLWSCKRSESSLSLPRK